MNRKRTPRSGFTLYELFVAMTVGSVIVMVATMLVGHALDWTTQSNHRQFDDQTMFRLTRQFRHDVHLARDAVIDDSRLKLSLDNESIVVYESSDSSVKRQQQPGDDGATPHRESYSWKRPRVVSFEVDAATDQVILKATTPTAFQTENETSPNSATPLWRCVRASVALRLKHQQGAIEP